MNTLDLQQGTKEWAAHRAACFNASDAPAMLGCSPYTTRAQLLRRMHSGVQPEVDAATQRLFDNGHRFEALARPLAEEFIGDDLAPLVGSIEVEGLSHALSASFDGLTFGHDTGFEHKHLNAELRACMKDEGNGYGLPRHFQVQMEQQLLVSGAERILFMASEWTEAGDLVEERHCWYASDPALRAEILAGWKQFERDLAEYVPAEPAQKVQAAPIESLPVPTAQVRGDLTITSNLDVFGAQLRSFIQRLPAKPATDQEFADCDAAVKALKRAEEALDAAEQQAIAQVSSIEELTRTIGDLRTVAKTARLATDKLVKARKEQMRSDEVARGRAAITSFVVGLNLGLGGEFVPVPAVDFGSVISGLKSIESIRNAIDSAVSRGKIEASQIANLVTRNQATGRELVPQDLQHLFPDIKTLLLKPADDFRAQVQARLAQHRAAEGRRLEAERARIRAEEEARARAQAQREQQEREAAERRQREEAEAQQQRLLQEQKQPVFEVARVRDEPLGAAANVHPMPTRTPAPAAPAARTLTLGDVCRRLGFTLTAAFVTEKLGVAGVKEANATKFSEPEYEQILAALLRHVMDLREQHCSAQAA